MLTSRIAALVYFSVVAGLFVSFAVVFFPVWK